MVFPILSFFFFFALLWLEGCYPEGPTFGGNRQAIERSQALTEIDLFSPDLLVMDILVEIMTCGLRFRNLHAPPPNVRSGARRARQIH